MAHTNPTKRLRKSLSELFDEFAKMINNEPNPENLAVDSHVAYAQEETCLRGFVQIVRDHGQLGDDESIQLVMKHLPAMKDFAEVVLFYLQEFVESIPILHNIAMTGIGLASLFGLAVLNQLAGRDDAEAKRLLEETLMLVHGRVARSEKRFREIHDAVLDVKSAHCNGAFDKLKPIVGDLVQSTDLCRKEAESCIAKTHQIYAKHFVAEPNPAVKKSAWARVGFRPATVVNAEVTTVATGGLNGQSPTDNHLREEVFRIKEKCDRFLEEVERQRNVLIDCEKVDCCFDMEDL